MMKRLPALSVVLWSFVALPVHAAEFQSDWQGTRPWIGPEFWASPLYDWETVDGAVEVNASSGRLLHLLTWHVAEPEKGFVTRTTVELLAKDGISNPARVWAGFAVGVRGNMDDTRHVAVWPKARLNAGIRADGRLMIGDAISPDSLPGKGPAELALSGDGKTVTLKATRGERSIAFSTETAVGSLRGNVCLAADSPRKPTDPRGPIRARFRQWNVAGEGIAASGVEPFGPVLWSQYTRQGRRAKLSVQMPPIGAQDSQEVKLEIRSAGGDWTDAGSAPIDPLARTAVFAVDLPSEKGRFEYRALYLWQGKEHAWGGTFIEDPATGGRPLRIGVFSCDNGYAFPLPTMTRNVAVQDPNLLFFAGDQIYESYGGLGAVRTPLDKAMLDYLRKFYQFGWTWRELLRDRPSIVLPDDHDVFQGNLWGAGGRATKNQNAGGYVMPPEWVRAVERTQTGHLPDAADPEPVAQGIGVYFTRMEWGGVPFAILEDRKWKSGPDATLPKNRQSLTVEQIDVKGASLLGERQEKFLAGWAAATRDAPLRFVLSQTIFCKGHTHAGRELKKDRFDFDSNGWPQSGRRRALLPLKGDNTVMLHGDQHLGLFARQGIDDWNDGPWAFMVPGTANGFPRAWWPDDGRITGDFTDTLGNKLTVLAAANPEQGSNTARPGDTMHPEKVAQIKGSGHGIVEVSPDRKTARFEMWRYASDAAAPKDGDQFDGFPQTLTFGR